LLHLCSQIFYQLNALFFILVILFHYASKEKRKDLKKKKAGKKDDDGDTIDENGVWGGVGMFLSILLFVLSVLLFIVYSVNIIAAVILTIVIIVVVLWFFGWLYVDVKEEGPVCGAFIYAIIAMVLTGFLLCKIEHKGLPAEKSAQATVVVTPVPVPTPVPMSESAKQAVLIPVVSAKSVTVPIPVENTDLLYSPAQFSKNIELSSEEFLAVSDIVERSTFAADIKVIRLPKVIHVNKTVGKIIVSFHWNKGMFSNSSSDFYWTSTVKIEEMAIFTKEGIIKIPSGTKVALNWADSGLDASFCIKQ
jgi:hypothetical protein